MKYLSNHQKVVYFAFLFIQSFLVQAQGPVTYQEVYSNLSFAFPVEVVNSGDGTNRLFVVEQAGTIDVFNSDELSPASSLFLNISSLVRFSSGQEMGLLGLAFHPNYEANGLFYVYYTAAGTGNVQIAVAEYRVSVSNPNQADPASRRELFRVTKNQPNSNHNGGKIAFGPDGYLYISFGDGGGGGDPEGNAQNLNNFFGSILRLDVDRNGNNPLSANGNYEIPSDNPRVNLSGQDELYAWGIRNTWKFSFDPATNRCWAADVGQNATEEINLIVKGGNYGWNRFEGSSIHRSATTLITTPDTKPVFQYAHTNGDKSVTGGYVYRGASTNTKLQGKYIYGDYVTGRVWSLDYNATTGTATSTLLFRTTGQFISAFVLDEEGELYFSSYGSTGKIYKIVGGSTTNSVLDVNGEGFLAEFQNGINGQVEALAVYSDKVYAGGLFQMAGDKQVSNIAMYELGKGWSNLVGGSNGIIKALAVDANGNLYAGGEFTSIGGVNANNIARWNGTTWSAMGTGTSGLVSKIGINGLGAIYAGGAFENAGGILVRNIARWNGTSWVALPDGSTSISGTNNEVRSIAFDAANNLYIGGNFAEAGGKTANRIAVYNGTAWSTLGAGTSGFVQSIVVTNDYVYLGGNFALADTNTVNRIVRWNKASATWTKLDLGTNGNVNDMVLLGGYLYIGGNFETVNRTDGRILRMNNLARYSTNTGWQALGNMMSVGANNGINTLSVYNGNKIILGGNFSNLSAVNAMNIGVWSDTSYNKPIVSTISRNSGRTGQVIIVKGLNFSAVNGISIGRQSVPYVVTSDTSITLTLNTSARTGDILLSNIIQSSTGPKFTFIDEFTSPSLVRIQSCQNVNFSLYKYSILTGSYQWQKSDPSAVGSSPNPFVNISGATSSTLIISGLTGAMTGTKYRLLINGNPELDLPSNPIEYILRFVNHANTGMWETASNWSCGTVPDINSDVFIPANTNVSINLATSIRSLTTFPTSNLILIRSLTVSP